MATPISKSARIAVSLGYGVGLLSWFLVWFLHDGFTASYSLRVLWVPFGLALFIMSANLILILCANDLAEYSTEVTVIEFVERNAAHIVTATTGSLIIGAAAVAIKGGAALTLPPEFVRFQTGAFILAVCGVLPLYWIPADKVTWLGILRHWKTVPFSMAISLFLSGLIVLLNWLGTPY